MMIGGRAILALRVCLVMLFAALLALQTFSFPGQYTYLAQEDPDAARWRWPLTALAAYWLLCVQVVVVCTWRLLSLVRADRIVSDTALTSVDGIVWSIAAAWTVLVAVGGAVLGLLMVVMRARQATTLRTDMDAVI